MGESVCLLTWVTNYLVLPMVALHVSRIAAALGVAWSTANDAVLAEGQRLLTDQPGRLDGVPVVGVDKHA